MNFWGLEFGKISFLSVEYALFLTGLAVIYWLMPRIRLWVLLVANLAFYALIQVQFVGLLLASTFINFWLGLQIKRHSQGHSQARGLILGLGLILNLGLLIFFKYIPFLAIAIGHVFNWPESLSLGNWATKNVIAPLAVSFFTFEMISYLIDTYRGAAPADNLLNFAVYKTFFPKLISGPIVRYQEFVPQIQSSTKLSIFSASNLVDGLWLIAAGAVKKGIFADNLGQLVDLSFSNLQRAGSIDLWLTLCAFSLQIFFDFSGYIDIANGSALILGFKLPANFDFPYFASSISEFWRRWHMTLGNWLRDYLYIPLGGSRRGILITCGNLLIVMLVAGIWHGANWGFVIWGMWHGLCLAAHRLIMAVGKGVAWFWQTGTGKIIAIALTQFLVLVSWIPFRLPNLADTQIMLQRLWGHQADPQFGLKIYVQALGLTTGQIALLLLGLVLIMAISYRCDRTHWSLSWQAKLFLVPICLYLVAILAPQRQIPFIYFDF